MSSNQTYKLLHSKWNHKLNKKTTHRMGNKNCKWYDWQGSYDMIANEMTNKIQLLWHFPQYTNRLYNLATKKIIKKLNSKMGRYLNRYFWKELNKDGQ